MARKNNQFKRQSKRQGQAKGQGQGKGQVKGQVKNQGQGKNKKTTKAAQAASAALKGSQTTPDALVHASRDLRPVGTELSFLDRSVFGSRITWRAVALFLTGCVMLDILLWAVVALGFGSCYGVLCLF